MKKKTRAYKVGFNDGQNNKYNNTFAEGSTRYNDYKQGFTEGRKS